MASLRVGSGWGRGWGCGRGRRGIVGVGWGREKAAKTLAGRLAFGANGEEP